MMDDLSRPARLPSEAFILPAMDARRDCTRKNAMLSALARRQHWPEIPSNRLHTLNNALEQERALMGLAQNAGSSGAANVTMGQAALQAVMRGKSK